MADGSAKKICSKKGAEGTEISPDALLHVGRRERIRVFQNNMGGLVKKKRGNKNTRPDSQIAYISVTALNAR